MKCKCCNTDFTAHMRTIKETGKRVLEDMCITCRRWVYVPRSVEKLDVLAEVFPGGYSHVRKAPAED